MEAQTFVPREFYCPITGDLMVDPVSDPNGNSYEKDSIIKWLSKNETSPITRDPLNSSQLVDNKALKRSIDEIRGKISADRLKIDTQISDVKLKPFRDSLGGIELKSYYLDDKLFVNIHTPDIEVRPPVDIVLCIDGRNTIVLVYNGLCIDEIWNIQPSIKYFKKALSIDSQCELAKVSIDTAKYIVK